jgi:hypothetical protein
MKWGILCLRLNLQGLLGVLCALVVHCSSFVTLASTDDHPRLLREAMRQPPRKEWVQVHAAWRVAEGGNHALFKDKRGTAINGELVLEQQP